MDLDTVDTLVRPRTRGELPVARPGDAFLAGGTFLMSEPQPALRRLVDLAGLGWAPIEEDADGLRIAATCTLERLARVSPLFEEACDCLWGSFKIQKAATVGGNLCLALPAAPIAALAVALDGVCEVWRPDGGTRTLAASAFVTGSGDNALLPGELLRAIRLPRNALARPAVLRQASLTRFGRSASLVIATPGALTVTAATRRPVVIALGGDSLDASRRGDRNTPLGRDEVDALIDRAIPDTLLYDDVHGDPAWRRHMTHVLARDALGSLGAGPG